MKVALIGYGKMGKTIHEFLNQKNYEVPLIINSTNYKEQFEKLNQVDVAIEFTQPNSVEKNILECFKNNVPVVSGTTGITAKKLNQIKAICEKQQQTLVYATNFSIGVNIIFELNKKLAKIMSEFTEYKVKIEETHHIHKLDSPSGTAISLAEQIIKNNNHYQKWHNSIEDINFQIPIMSKRKAEVIGIHKIEYKNQIDKIQIKHKAKNRDGFAIGAVFAAEKIVNQKGFLTMDKILNFS